MEPVILVDFGSTYTKTCVFDMEEKDLVMSTRTPSTVGTDASVGFLINREAVKQQIGKSNLEKARTVASSSAAGGLRMVVVGLTPKYSLRAGIHAALGAGARVVQTYSNRLSAEDMAEIIAIHPEILLLCGGIEHGNPQRICANAAMLAETPCFTSPVVYAGNKSVAMQIRGMLLAHGKECYLSENLFPTLKELNSLPVNRVLRDIFMKRIAGMKGIAQVQDYIQGDVMPTPAAVFEAGALLSKEPVEAGGFGRLMLLDVGGATTDVYSYIENEVDSVKYAGAPEPEHKRTVEGDLGVRSSAVSLLAAEDVTRIAEHTGLTTEEIHTGCQYRASHAAFLPKEPKDKILDYELTCTAVYKSARRHGGQILNAYARGQNSVQEGKNLSRIQTVIGTGGAIIDSLHPRAILEKVLKTDAEKQRLLPEQSKMYLDTQYLLYAIGLAASIDADTARIIAKKNLRSI
ncbi:MAG: glutamate mutase L [Lachnospiraceae bacterium]